MQITCRCGCNLDIQSIDFDCIYDMTVYVKECEDCDADAVDQCDKQETRGDNLEYEIVALQEEIQELKMSIEETKFQMGDH